MENIKENFANIALQKGKYYHRDKSKSFFLDF